MLFDEVSDGKMKNRSTHVLREYFRREDTIEDNAAKSLM